MILIQKFAVTVEIYFCIVIVRRYFEGLRAQTCFKEGRASLSEYGWKTVLMEERSKRIGASRTSMMKRRMSSSRVKKRRGGREPRRIPEISSRSRKGRLHTLGAREFHCVWRKRRGKGIGCRRDITFSGARQNEHLQAEFVKFTSDSWIVSRGH